MAKGLFTQGVCVLLREPISIERLKQSLQRFELVGQHESIDDDDAPQTLVYNYLPEVNGHLLVTPADGPWPDDMGDPDETPERFVAWSLGQYAPLAFPGCLQRAVEQSWGWQDAPFKLGQHSCHIRFLISYVLGVGEPEESDGELPLVPDDYDALEELYFLMRAVSDVLIEPEAICYFNPGGEVLRDENGLRQGLNYAWSHELPPLDMWTNVRLFRATPEWSLMDTVGNGQFDLPDVEAVFPTDDQTPGDVEAFLRNVSLQMLHDGETIEAGVSEQGPGEKPWKAIHCFDALSDPPRATVRWFPETDSPVPEELLDRGEPPEEFEGEFGDEEDDEIDSHWDGISEDDELDDDLE